MKRVQAIQFSKDPYIEDVGPRKIKSMEFCTFSGAEIEKAAEVQVWRGMYYDSTRRPIENGLLDPHMGPPNKGCVCATCHGSYNKCPGHFGYLKLALPTFHEGYLGTIVNILKCICKSCARILMEEKKCEEILKKMRNPKLDHLRKAALVKEIIKNNNKVITCTRCGYENGKVKRNLQRFGILYEGTDGYHKERAEAISHTKESKTAFKTDCSINPAKIYSLFTKMLDEDIQLLNLSDRPEKLLITSIPVPPISVRPSVIVEGSLSNENDITERLKRIIQANSMLSKELEEASATSSCLDKWEQLQCEVAYYMNSDVKGFPLKYISDGTKSGFSQRMKGKTGRIRGNLCGKRVEYTGRTVISPDPNLKITQIAIPTHMARILTYPERVSPHNIEKLRQCVRNGPDKYPGARMVQEPDGESRHLMFSARKHVADELKYGYIVDRHLEDGDVVLFNRQPSLHRMSMMCHRARIMPWRTLRFNESVCNPYNADFDGDEMNIHVPQTEEARAEALMLMGVQNNLCTPKNGEVLVASTQDFLTSSFLITRKDTFYDRANFALMCSYMGDAMDNIDFPTPAILKPIELWTGKQLFSVLVRPNAEMRVYLNFTVKEKNYTKSDPKKGTGTREFESMCPCDGFVYFRNSELISGQLGKATLGNGNKDGLYSVLLRDYNALAAATCMNRLAKLSARWIGNHGFSIGIDDVQPEKQLNEKKEVTIEGYYKKCDDVIQLYNAGKLKRAAGRDEAQTLEDEVTQHLNAIREATAKVCMGGLHWRNSPLIMSQCGSKGSPINISQMIACVGQQSVGGLRAPDGFIDRSLPHFPRNSKAPAAKGFVANSFYSGLTATEFFFHTMGGREGLVDTAVKTAATGYISRRLIKVLEDLFIHYDTTVRNASGCIVQFRYGDDGMDPVCMEGKDGVPLDFNRMLLKVKAICPVAGKGYLSPKETSEAVERRLAENDRTADSPCSEKFNNSLRKALSLPEKVAGQDYMEALEKVPHQIQKLTKDQLEVLLNICISRYNVKKIEAGTAVGAIGAHSIGEPGTQMTLKTFHFAGVASMNVTLGVPRISEIINASKNIRTPIITVNLECDDDKEIAQRIKGRIEKTNLGQIAESVELVITTRSASLCITLDIQDIQDIQESGLWIDANMVKESILKASKFPMIQRKGIERPKKIKLDEKDIRVLNERELEIIPLNFNNRDELLFALQSLKNMLPFVAVKGIKTVERAAVNSTKKKERDGKEKDRYTILVEGTGLLSVMGTDGVDGVNTCSNHVMEVYQTLGIEAARRLIIDEIVKVMKDYGMSIDIRHMFLLADCMTVRGEVLGITRFGLAKMGKGVLMQASFEQPMSHLYGASVSGEEDKIEGVSEHIIMGVPPTIGTGILRVRQRDHVSPEEVQAKNYEAQIYEINAVMS